MRRFLTFAASVALSAAVLAAGSVTTTVAGSAWLRQGPVSVHGSAWL